MSNRKDTLIYQCASEAVMQARMRISRVLKEELVEQRIREIVDDILFDAERRSGEWAIRAAKADTRTHKTVRQIIRQ